VTACDRCHELLGGYVLEALEPGEESAVSRHLHSCPDCRKEHVELAALPMLLDVLGSADAPPEGPPRELEESVLDRFARERRRVPAPRRPRRRRRRLVGAVAAAAAAAAVAAALVLTWPFGSDGGDEAFGHVRLRATAGTADASGYANLQAVRAGTGVDIRVRGLPAGPSPVYEVWCVPDDGRWISGGTFRVDRRGRARVTLTSAARPGDYEVMLVTRRSESRPAGGRGPNVLEGRVEY
jgi:Anti-sigma-K factor rskA/Putative zinc-finger